MPQKTIDKQVASAGTNGAGTIANGNGATLSLLERLMAKRLAGPPPSIVKNGVESGKYRTILETALAVFAMTPDEVSSLDVTEDLLPNAKDREDGKKVASVYSACNMVIRGNAEFDGKVRCVRRKLSVVLTNAPKSKSEDEDATPAASATEEGTAPEAPVPTADGITE